MLRKLSYLLPALAVVLGTTTAGATTTVPTKTRLTVSDLSTGMNNSGAFTDVTQWKAVVRGVGGPSPKLARGRVTFILADGPRVLARFTGSAAHPAECTFTNTITGDSESIKAAPPDICSGGIAGDVNLTNAEINSPSIGIRAIYVGGSGWRKSSSGRVNPETIRSGASASA